MSPPPFKPRHHLLVSHPRSASNLLVRILNVQEQPSVHTGSPYAGYQLLPIASAIHDNQAFLSPLTKWSPELREKIQTSCEKSVADLHEIIIRAEREGGVAFDKEHVQFLIHPVRHIETVFKTPQSSGPDFWDGGPVQLPIHSDSSNGWQEHTTDTLLTDEFLKAWTPIFLIRNPILSFTSLWRTQLVWYGGNPDADLENFPNDPERFAKATEMINWCSSYLSFTWTRNLVNWYAGRNEDSEEVPMIVDASDLIATPGPLVTKLAERMGLDVQKLKFKWDALTEEEFGEKPMGARIMSRTLFTSTGVISANGGDVEAGNVEAVGGAGEHGQKDEIALDGVRLSVEVEKWKAEFGRPAADRLEKHVRGSWDDYLWLREKRMRV
jgi:hypothetical protein